MISSNSTQRYVGKKKNENLCFGCQEHQLCHGHNFCLTTYWQNNLDVVDNGFHINLPNTFFFYHSQLLFQQIIKNKWQVLPPLPLLTSPEPDRFYFTTENPALSPTNLMEKFWIPHLMKKQFLQIWWDVTSPDWFAKLSSSISHNIGRKYLVLLI